jgi:hypothetical protein
VVRALFSVAVVAAVAAGTASAAGGEKVQTHFNAADQAAARRAVAQRGDLGSASGWTGGPTRPDLSAAPTCPNFHPKQHDLVMTGAAASNWNYSGLQIYTQSQVMKTPAMVAADWQRTVLAPAAIPCQRSHVVKQLGAGVTFVSFRRVLLPAVATRSRAYVLLVDVKTQTGKVRVAIELILIGRGRTEITIESTAPNLAQKVVAQADAQLARTLAARATL